MTKIWQSFELGENPHKTFEVKNGCILHTENPAEFHVSCAMVQQQSFIFMFTPCVDACRKAMDALAFFFPHPN